MKRYLLLIAFLIVGALVALKFKQSSTQGITQAAREAEETASDLAKQGFDSVSDSVHSAQLTGEQMAQDTAEAVQDATDQVADKANEAKIAVQNGVEAGVAAVTETAEDVAANTKEITQDAARVAANAVQDGANAITDKADSIKQGLSARLVKNDKGEITQIETPTLDFEANQAILKDSSKEALSDLAALINSRSEISKVQIEGYTDNSGNPITNKALSLSRAKAVAAYLEDLGVPSEKLVAKGFGSESPIYPNDTAENRSKNRRVEFKVVR